MRLFLPVLSLAVAALATVGTATADSVTEAIESVVRDRFAAIETDLTIEIALDRTLPELDMVDGETVRVDGFVFDRINGRFTAVLSTVGGAARDIPISGMVAASAEVPVLQRTFRRGEIIPDDAVTYLNIPAGRLSEGMIFNAAELVGKAARRTLRPDRPIRVEDVMGPIVVAKNSRVNMVFRSGAVELVATGRALADGGNGETIPVLNLGSNRTVQGLIVEPGLVLVGANGE